MYSMCWASGRCSTGCMCAIAGEAIGVNLVGLLISAGARSIYTVPSIPCMYCMCYAPRSYNKPGPCHADAYPVLLWLGHS